MPPAFVVARCISCLLACRLTWRRLTGSRTHRLVVLQDDRQGALVPEPVSGRSDACRTVPVATAKAEVGGGQQRTGVVALTGGALGHHSSPTRPPARFFSVARRDDVVTLDGRCLEKPSRPIHPERDESATKQRMVCLESDRLSCYVQFVGLVVAKGSRVYARLDRTQTCGHTESCDARRTLRKGISGFYGGRLRVVSRVTVSTSWLMSPTRFSVKWSW